MALYYLDANALMRWAEGLCSTPSAEQAAAAARVKAIVKDDANVVAISEHSFIEFHDTVLRYRFGNFQEWNDVWLAAVQTRLMEWIEAGRVDVQPPAPRAIDVAMSYISMARGADASLKAVDAIHLHRAIEWAHEESVHVTIVTGDKAFARFLALFPAALQYVEIEEINVTQPPEPGTPISD